MTNEEKMQLLEKHAAELSEIFDCVQILAASLNLDGLTTSCKKGSGLWHARRGLAEEFIEEDLSEDQAIRIARRLDPPDEYPKAQ